MHEVVCLVCGKMKAEVDILGSTWRGNECLRATPKLLLQLTEARMKADMI